MENCRAYVPCFLSCCWLTFIFLTEANGARHTPESYSMNADRSSHLRSLSAAYQVEICRWLEDSSCQLNPEYALHLLADASSQEDTEVQDAVVDEAACLSMTHEGACISHESCTWVEQYSAHRANSRHVCQFSESERVLTSCTHLSLRAFVQEYMSCRKQLGGSCLTGASCEHVQLSEENQGCGIRGRMVLDLIMGTPASQTETVAHLVESSSVLQNLTLPSLTVVEPESTQHGKRRRMLQTPAADGDEDEEDSDGDVLTVEDDQATTSGTSAERSQITGTGTVDGGDESPEFGISAEEAGTAEEGPSRDTERTESNPEEHDAPPPTEEEKPTELPPEPSAPPQQAEEEEGPVAGSVSFDVSDYLESDVDDSSEEDEISQSQDAQISTPLTLVGPTEHLFEVNTSEPVRLRDIIAVLEPLTSVLEKGPNGRRLARDFRDAARELETMRFRLDSRSLFNVSETTWNASNIIWWTLQESAQSLDYAYTNDIETDHTITISVVRLLMASEHARDAWRPRRGSNGFESLNSVETRLETIQSENQLGQSEEPDPSILIISSIDQLISIAVNAFNETLQDVYPLKLNPSFAEKYNQTWVRLVIARNYKWCAIQQAIATESPAGGIVIDMVQGLYRVHSPMASISAVPYMGELAEIVDTIVGCIVATHADLYTINNLPEDLNSPSLRSFQRGPQITAATLDAVRRRAIQNLEETAYVDIEGFLPASDAIARFLETVIRMIDAKAALPVHSHSLPEETAILMTMEAALNVITAWNNLARSNNFENSVLQDPFGHSSITDLTLSLVGCLTLAPAEDDQCRSIDRSHCQIRGLKGWSSTSGMYSLSPNHTICAPEENAHSLSHLFDDIPPDSASFLVAQIRDLYLITAFCPYLPPEVCRADERCDLFVIEDRLGCRPSSNFINFIVESEQIARFAGTSNSCESYLGLPICGNLKSEDACIATDSCLWADGHPPNFNGSRDICTTDWIEQLRVTHPSTLEENGLMTYTVEECREQTTQRDCQRQNLDETELYGHETQLPSADSSTPEWVAYLISVAVPVAVAAMLYTIWRIFRKPVPAGGAGKKKGKGKKKGEAVHVPRVIHLPMFQHAFDVASSGSPSVKRDDFDFVREAFEESSFVTGSASRVSSQPDRMERHTSGTTAEISEIQPISEDEEETSSSSDDLDSEAGWTISSEEWLEEEDGVSVPDQPT